MSGTIKRNKFIPIIVLGLLVLLFLAVFVSCSPNTTDPGQGSANTVPQGDNDTPTETLGSITGEVSLLSEQLTELEAQSREKLQQELKASAEQTKSGRQCHCRQTKHDNAPAKAFRGHALSPCQMRDGKPIGCSSPCDCSWFLPSTRQVRAAFGARLRRA